MDLAPKSSGLELKISGNSRKDTSLSTKQTDRTLMESKLSIYLILSVISLSLVFGLPYGKDSGVINLTKANFAKEVFGSEHVWLIEFYAPCK